MFMMKRKSIPNDENKVPDYDENKHSLNITHKHELWKTSKIELILTLNMCMKEHYISLKLKCFVNNVWKRR